MIVEDTLLLIIGGLLSVVALIVGAFIVRELVLIVRGFIHNMKPLDQADSAGVEAGDQERIARNQRATVQRLITHFEEGEE